MKKKQLQLFSSLDKLRIILFWEILKEKNPFLLDADFKPENKYSEEEQTYIVNTWERLYDDYFTARDDNKGRQMIRDNEDELKLLYKINLLGDIRSHLVNLHNNSIKLTDDNFNELKYSAFAIVTKIENKLKFQAFTAIEDAVKLIERALNSLNNTYNIKKKRNEQEIDKQIENVYNVVASVESVLERAIPNINEISVLHWLAYEKSANEKIKAIKDRNKK